MSLQRRVGGVDPVASVMTLRAGWALSGLGFPRLSLRYFGAGGQLRPDQSRAGLAGSTTLNGLDHDRLARALNEHLADHGLPGFPVAYADELTPGATNTGPS